MEDNRFSGDSKKLLIGGFSIACSGLKLDGRRLIIPHAGMAFYQPEITQSDFHYRVQTMEPDSSGQLLFGSNEFQIPTFLYQHEDGSIDWITKNRDDKINSAFYISADWKHFTLYEDNCKDNGENAFRLFGSVFSYAVLNHRACVLHGVVLEHEGRGILVCAPSGTGKTTHTRMWRDCENALIINGDRCLCRYVDDKWYAYGMPWAGSSGEYINRRVPLSAIVSLTRGTENSTRMMNIYEKTIFLMQRIFAPTWTGDLQNKAFEIIDDMAAEIPMIELSCRPDRESVMILKKALSELC